MGIFQRKTKNELLEDTDTQEFSNHLTQEQNIHKRDSNQDAKFTEGNLICQTNNVVKKDIFNQKQKRQEDISIIKTSKGTIKTNQDFKIDTNSDIISTKERKSELYAMIFRYGCLSSSQICQKFSPQSLAKLLKNDEFDSCVSNEENVFFLNGKGVKEFAEIIGKSQRELRKNVLFHKNVKESNLPDIIKQINALMAIEESYQYFLYDWFSCINPKKLLPPIKIRRCDQKRGGLSVKLLVILQKKKKKESWAFIVRTLSTNSNSLYTMGEQLEKITHEMKHYDEFLLNQEEKEKWWRKLKLYTSVHDIGAIFIVPSEILEDLLEKMRLMDIKSSIYLTSFNRSAQKKLEPYYGLKKGFLKIKVKK